MKKRKHPHQTDHLIDLGEGHSLRVELRRPVYTTVFTAYLYFDDVFIGNIGVCNDEPIAMLRGSGTTYQQFFPMEVEK